MSLEDVLAESGGFEPPVELLVLQRFSKPPPSATRPTLQFTLRLHLRSAGMKHNYRVIPGLRATQSAPHPGQSHELTDPASELHSFELHSLIL